MKRRLAMKLAAFAAVTGLPGRAGASLVPPGFLNCVVAIGFTGPGVQNGVTVPKMWHTTGTGFFYGHLTEGDPDPGKRSYNVFLVTAKHVVAGLKKIQAENPALGSPKIRLNPVASSSTGEEFDLVNDIAHPEMAWTDHPKGKDVSIIGANFNAFRDRGLEIAFFASDSMVARIDKLQSLGVSAGDGIFVLGFPMDMAGIQKNYVIIRQGVIARISELLDHASESFLIDSFVFPGNSGGPVVLKPEVVSITGTKTNGSAYLVGLVVESLNYVDTATSNQTGKPRISFEENAGLANVLPADYIEEAIVAAKDRYK